MASLVPVVAIDGPGGSGKGTLARLLAQTLGWHLLDSGALYRLVGLAAGQAGIDLDDEPRLAALAASLDVRFGDLDGQEQIWLAGQEVSAPIRTEPAGEAASRVAQYPAVRAALLARQRAFAEYPGLVADGRDMGTVVFPAAVLKVFLSASPEERAARRHKQLKEKGIDVSLRALSEEIEARDRRDTERPVAPLRPAADARVLDSTKLAPAQVLEQIVSWLKPLDIGPE
jgi:cytidylate kinase